MHFAAPDFEINRVQGLCSGEGLREVLNFKRQRFRSRFVGGRRYPYFVCHYYCLTSFVLTSLLLASEGTSTWTRLALGRIAQELLTSR